MNISKLKEDMTFKNYKDLCNFIEEPILYGNSKQSQLKEWNRYFNYNKERNSIKYTIEHINNIKQPKVDNRTKWYDEVSTDILFRLCLSNKKMYITKSELLRQYGLINKMYSTYRIPKTFPHCQDLTNEERKQLLSDYQKMTYRKIEYPITNTLAKMKNRNIIDYKTTYLVILKNEVLERECTEEEFRRIENISSNLLKQYGFNFLIELTDEIERKKFDQAKQLVLEQNGFSNISKVYYITYCSNEPLVKENYKLANKFNMNEKILQSITQTLYSKQKIDNFSFQRLSLFLSLMNFMHLLE